MTKPRWLLTAVAACAIVTGCQSAQDSAQTAPTPRPQHADQLTHPAVTAGHIAAADMAALSGDRRVLRAQLQAMQRDQLRDMHIADPSRRIDPEAARTAVRPLAGIRSSTWIDRSNLLVLVGGGKYRMQSTIDRICLALEPLGDTLGVTVHLQDMTATTSEASDSISRNCQLEEGEQALGQPRRQVDALDPGLRRAFRAQQRSVSK